MSIGSGTQYGSVHPSATPIAALAPRTTPNTIATHGGDRQGTAVSIHDLGSTEAARERRCRRRVAIATMTP